MSKKAFPKPFFFIPTEVNGEFQQWQESSASNESILQNLKSDPFAKDTPLVLQYKNSMDECVPLEKKMYSQFKSFHHYCVFKGGLLCLLSLNFSQHISQSHISVSSASFTPVIYSLDIVIAIDTALGIRFF